MLKTSVEAAGVDHPITMHLSKGGRDQALEVHAGPETLSTVPLRIDEHGDLLPSVREPGGSEFLARAWGKGLDPSVQLSTRGAVETAELSQDPPRLRDGFGILGDPGLPDPGECEFGTLLLAPATSSLALAMFDDGDLVGVRLAATRPERQSRNRMSVAMRTRFQAEEAAIPEDTCTICVTTPAMTCYGFYIQIGRLRRTYMCWQGTTFPNQYSSFRATGIDGAPGILPA